MKKVRIVLVSLLLLLLSVPLMAQKFELKADYFIAGNGNETVISEKVDIDITLDLENKKIIIYSNNPKIIDFEPTGHYINENGFTVTECSATDNENKKPTLVIEVKEEENLIIIFLAYGESNFLYACSIPEGN